MGVEMFCKYKLHIGFQRLRMQGKKKKKEGLYTLSKILYKLHIFQLHKILQILG